LVAHLVTSEPLSRLIADVKWLAGVLGPARDLDVLVLETLPGIRRGARGADAPPSRAIRSFSAKVAAQRKRARSAAREAVASRRFVHLILAAAMLAATPAFGVSGSATAAATEAPVRDFAARLLARRQKKLLARGEGLPDAPAGARHEARIAAKKLRYATEFFADVFPGKRARAYRKSLTRLQDVLGVTNDTVVAARLAREIAGADSNAAALLQGWAAAQATRANEDLARAWRDFSRAKPFWD
jgi:CHAD domain-containing protein